MPREFPSGKFVEPGRLPAHLAGRKRGKDQRRKRSRGNTNISCGTRYSVESRFFLERIMALMKIINKLKTSKSRIKAIPVEVTVKGHC